MKKNFERYFIDEHCTIIQAIQRIELLSGKDAQVLFVIDSHQKIIGSLTDGDIRRGLIKGFKLEENVKSVMKEDFESLIDNEFNAEDVRKLKDDKIRLVPLLYKESTRYFHTFVLL